MLKSIETATETSAAPLLSMMAIVGGTNSRVTMEDAYQKISNFYEEIQSKLMSLRLVDGGEDW